jgi:hypothetical protein
MKQAVYHMLIRVRRFRLQTSHAVSSQSPSFMSLRRHIVTVCMFQPFCSMTSQISIYRRQ